jgi:hypothetical protein
VVPFVIDFSRDLNDIEADTLALLDVWIKFNKISSQFKLFLANIFKPFLFSEEIDDQSYSHSLVIGQNEIHADYKLPSKQ